MSDTEIEIDEGLVRALLREQHADLAEGHLRYAATGWDHQLWRIGAELVVRLPNFDVSSPHVLREFRWLPGLAPLLPLPVPVPQRLGEPSARFPRPWSVTTWVPGDPGDHSPVSRGDVAAKTLAEFLGALHRPAPDTAPLRPERAGPLGPLTDGFEQHLAQAQVDGGTADALRAIWRDAVAAPDRPVPGVWVHADLHPANVVVRDGTLAGVIDFGDLCSGDPATDLAAAWVLLPDGAADLFFAAYGAADEATVRRARAWAALRALVLVSIGRAGDAGLPGGKPTWGPAGRATIDRLLAEV